MGGGGRRRTAPEAYLSDTPWRDGRFHARQSRGQLLFGHMYEDWAIEDEVLPAGGHIFCIASGGCTAMALAESGRSVTAVDINPAQIAYVRERLDGRASRFGAAEQLMRGMRQFLPLLGWTSSRLQEFLEMDSGEEQIAYWRSMLDTRRWRWSVDTFLSAHLLRLGFSSDFLRVLPADFAFRLRRRMEETFARHPNRTNPYAHLLLAGKPTDIRTRAALELVVADAATYLEGRQPAQFDGFTLSNIGDGVAPSYLHRLKLALRRAGKPGAPVIWRSFAEPAAAESREWRERERCPLWGRVVVDAL